MHHFHLYIQYKDSRATNIIKSKNRGSICESLSLIHEANQIGPATLQIPQCTASMFVFCLQFHVFLSFFSPKLHMD